MPELITILNDASGIHNPKPRMNYSIQTRFKTPSQMQVIKQWCEEAVGARRDTINPDGIWTCYWEGPQIEYGTAHKWWFVNEKDAIIFALKWT